MPSMAWFTKQGDRWRCVEHPDLVMLRDERYRVGEREHGSLEEVRDELRHSANRARLQAVSQEVANPRSACRHPARSQCHC
jgi:hypothetical protein